MLRASISGAENDIVRAVPRRPHLALAFASCVFAVHARAADCPSSEPFSSCIDANALWLRPGRSAFAGIGSARATPQASAGIAFGATLLERPLVLELRGPAPGGRELALVERAVDQHTLIWLGLPHRLTLELAMVSVLHQTGAGPDALRAQRAVPLPPSAVRDTRAGLYFAALDTPGLGLAARAELALPTGDRSAFASSGAPTFAPALGLEWRLPPLSFGFELGARLRRPVELGTLRRGSELYAAAGAALQLSGAFAVSVEAFALPSLIDATSARAREHGVSTRSVPAEWFGRLRWSSPDGASFAIGAGSGLPLGSESRNGGSERMLSATSPELRLHCDLRYAP